MSQDAPIADPCINICMMDRHGRFCQGCQRSSLEIGRWPRMSELQKAELVVLIAQRTAPASFDSAPSRPSERHP